MGSGLRGMISGLFVNNLCYGLKLDGKHDKLTGLIYRKYGEMRNIMEKCKFCQAELAENSSVCPSCGKDNAEVETVENAAVEEVTEAVETAAEETAAEEQTPAEETVEAAQAEEAPAAEEAEEAPAEIKEGKKATPGKIALAVAAVIVLLAALIALIVTGLDGGKSEEATAATETGAAVEETVVATVPADGNPDDATCKGTYTVTDEEAIANKDTVVAKIGEHTLTNGQLQVYYWSMVNSYLSSEYGYYMMYYGAIDYTQPLDTQISAEDQSMTWQQYFLKEALDYWQMSQALADRSAAAGMEMSQENQEYLDNLETSLEETASGYGMTVEELLLNNVGPGAGFEEFRDFQELYYAGSTYYNAELAGIVPTEEDLEAFFAEHEEDYASSGVTKDGKFVDVRHILVSVEGGTTDENGTTTYSDEEWAACEAEAQAILDEWLAGDKTEDSFAALANEKSEDPGSNTTGGLYTQVYEGQMVQPFNDWCFDGSRAYGDYGLVQTSYGYHVMFYVDSQPMWKYYAESDWISEQSNKLIEEVVEGYPVEVEYEKIALGYIDLAS